ncbi:MAG: PIN domain-containing protein [Spirochaetaceae bacterium]|nr:PIN domain-containing protein [Spirochaetaceae bacterium]
MGYSMRVLLDTNIILYWLIPDNLFHTNARTIIKHCLDGKIKGYVTSHSLTDVFYICRKHFSIEQLQNLLLLLVSNFEILVEEKADFMSVLKETQFFDLEDGLQMVCAKNADLDYIVTENLKDFKNSKVKAISIETALKGFSV